MVLLYHLSGILETLNARVRRKLLVPPDRDAEPDATVSQTCVPPAQKLLARRCQPERDLGPHEFFGGNMLRRSDALMAGAFFCVLSVLVVPGAMSVSFKEWNVPTLGSRPHDPEPGPGGTIWWTGMFANVLGRLDPKTNEMKEYHATTAASGPHGLAFDKDGYLWFTANAKGYVGKLDPKTGDVVEYKLPEDVRDPHTPLIAPSGTVFFTAQGANYIGRINPKTGEIKVQKTPTERANPYGMVFTSKGTPFVCDFGTNKIIEFDPETLAIKEYELPNSESRPRRIAISPDDIIWYADYSRGYLGRLDPKTGKVTDWPSPSGPRSQPYGITYLNGAIWYVESAIRPNVLVRFDIKTEKFQSWTIPGGGGVVRNMKSTRDGNLVIAESGVNKVGLVLVGSKEPNSSR